MTSVSHPIAWPRRLRGPHWSVSLTVLLDIAALELSLLTGWLVRQQLAPWFPIELRLEHFQGLALGVLLLPIAYSLLGLYPGYGFNPAERLRLRIQATAFVFFLLLMWDYLVQEHQWSRGILAATAVASVILPPLFDELVRSALAKAHGFGEPVLILGAGHTGRHIVEHLLTHPEVGYYPAAVLDDNESLAGTEIAGVPVAGRLEEAGRFSERIRVAIIAMPHAPAPRLRSLLEELRFPKVIVTPDLSGLPSLWVTGFDLGGLLGIQVQRNLLQPHNLILKRLIDILVTLPLLAAAAPLIAAGALAVKLTSPGPAFFRQKRVGRGGRMIDVLKLRTMHVNAEPALARYLAGNPSRLEEWRSKFKLEDDPRIIPVIGPLLRRLSIDELPQLWQVLRGELSLVGPRPFPEYHMNEFPEAFRSLRLSVTPGVTGLWQVAARSKGNLQVQESLDTYYIRNWSLWLDYYILLRTVPTVLMARGAC